MRVMFALAALALASPSYADEKCGLFEDVVTRICIKSFSNAFGRDLGSFEGKRQEDENNFVSFTCDNAATVTRTLCDEGKFGDPRKRKVGECTFVSNVAEGSIQYACTYNEKPPTVRKLNKLFTTFRRSERAKFCKNAVSQVPSVAHHACR